MMPLLLPMRRTLSQLTDPAFVGVVWRSVLFAAVFFAAILAGTVAAIHRLSGFSGPIAWALDAVGSIAGSLLALWLFLPVAAIIGTFYVDRIARAVERRFYPHLPPARAAGIADLLADAIATGLKILGLNILALLVTLFLPGLGLPIGWAIASWAIGRGLFVPVAMRRLDRRDALSLYRAARPVILVQGAILAAAAYVPVLNLLIPVAGVAAMAHVAGLALARAGLPRATIYS